MYRRLYVKSYHKLNIHSVKYSDVPEVCMDTWAFVRAGEGFHCVADIAGRRFWRSTKNLITNFFCRAAFPLLGAASECANNKEEFVWFLDLVDFSIKIIKPYLVLYLIGWTLWGCSINDIKKSTSGARSSRSLRL